MKQKSSIFRKISRHKFLKSLVLSYTLLIAITASVVTFTLHYAFSVTSKEEVSAYTKSSLQQISFSTDLLYNQVTTLSTQLGTDASILTYIDSPGADASARKLNEYQIYRMLSHAAAMYPFIRGISIYSFDNSISVDYGAIPIDRETVAGHADQYLYCYPRSVQLGAGDAAKQIIPFVFYPNYRQTNARRFAVVINVSQSYVLDIMSRLGGYIIDARFLVVDHQGNVVASSDPAQFRKSFSDRSYVSRTLGSSEEQGSFRETVDGRDSVITYVQSKALNWYTLSVIPYDSSTRAITWLRNLLLLAVAAAAAVGFAFASYFAKKEYDPMENLLTQLDTLPTGTAAVDEYQLLSQSFLQSADYRKKAEQYISSADRFTKSYRLYSLLKGTYSLPSTDEAQKIFSGGADLWCVLLFRIDNYADKRQSENIALLRYAIGNIAQDVLKQKFSADCVDTEENELAAVLRFRDEQAVRELSSMVAMIQSFISQLYDATFSAAVSGVVRNPAQLHSAYQSAAEFVKYRLFYGPGCIVTAEMVKNHMGENSVKQVNISKKLAEAIRLGSRTEIQKVLDAGIRSMEHGVCYAVVAYCTQVATDLFRDFGELSTIGEEMKVVGRINDAETLEEIRQELLLLCDRLCLQLEEKSRKSSELKNAEIIDRILRYLNDNYSDAALSLEVVAAAIGLSAGYVGRLFKAYKGISLVEYLTELRMEKAKRLLASTDEPISRICARVGINSENYFFTLFKKSFGVTPAAYRKTVR